VPSLDEITLAEGADRRRRGSHESRVRLQWCEACRESHAWCDACGSLSYPHVLEVVSVPRLA
jgi:hypothetical protein